MGLFGYSTEEVQGLTADVPEYAVRVSKAIRGEDPAARPAYGPFTIEPRLKFLSAFCGSSVAGMSHARLKSVVGQPVDAPADRAEDYEPLAVGDRAIIALGDRPIFAGYCTGMALNVGEGGEAIHYSLSGPEWIWGGDPRGGCDAPVYGQVRRTAAADDTLVASLPGWGYTARSGLFVATAERCVFNRGGRRNMVQQAVRLSRGGEEDLNGYVFETPDRKSGSTALAAYWTLSDAARFLVLWHNEPNWTGIDRPDSELAKLPLPLGQMPETDVDGLGLWEALRRVLSPEWCFYVDPRPSSVDAWGGFAWRVFKRGVDRVGEGGADIRFNALGTGIAAADKSGVRLEAAKDGKSVANRVTVLGSGVRHVKLQYYGTMAISAGAKKLALQHGWSETEYDLAAFKETDPELGDFIDFASIESKGETLINTWRNRYCREGKDHLAHAHAFRLFVWNEAGELTGAGPKYAGTAANWAVPDLSGIADNTGLAEAGDVVSGGYARRRRPLIDTAYRDPTMPDQFRRIPPQVFLQAEAPDGESWSPWIRLRAGSDYRIDPERAAIWIVRDRLDAWRPLAQLEDYRTYATLLLTGKLLLMVEASIETDLTMQARVERTDGSGSPLVREMVVRAGRDFVRSSSYADGVDSPMGLTGVTVNDTDAAAELAGQYQRTGQDLRVHCSILTAADWPLQSIGRVLEQTGGTRTIRLAGGAGTRGAQIVGLSFDPAACKVEVMTESTAVKLGKRAGGRRAVKADPREVR